MIDEELRVWLIEANRNPGFGLPTEKAKNLIDSMVDEMLTVVVDSIFTPKIPLKMAASKKINFYQINFLLIIRRFSFHQQTFPLIVLLSF